MNWEALGAAAEFVAAIGVIASLLYLAFETRNNTKTMRASLSNDVLTASAELNDVIMNNPELRKIASKGTNPSLPITEFDTEEKDAFIYFARAVVMRYEGIYLLHKQGLVEPDVWRTRCEIAGGLLRIPIWAEFWETEQKIGLYTPGFTNEINSSRARNLPSPISASNA